MKRTCKKYFCLLLLLTCSILVNAQDTIIKKDGLRIDCKIILVDSVSIIYRPAKVASNNLIMQLSDVAIIKYANGQLLMNAKVAETIKISGPSYTKDGYQVIVIHPTIGESIDLAEKKKYQLFPSYYFSNRDFVSAQFLKKPDGTIILRAVVSKGKFPDKISSQKEVDRYAAKIVDRKTSAGAVAGAFSIVLGTVIVGLILLLITINSIFL